MTLIYLLVNRENFKKFRGLVQISNKKWRCLSELSKPLEAGKLVCKCHKTGSLLRFPTIPSNLGARNSIRRVFFLVLSCFRLGSQLRQGSAEKENWTTFFMKQAVVQKIIDDINNYSILSPFPLPLPIIPSTLDTLWILQCCVHHFLWTAVQQTKSWTIRKLCLIFTLHLFCKLILFLISSFLCHFLSILSTLMSYLKAKRTDERQDAPESPFSDSYVRS